MKSRCSRCILVIAVVILSLSNQQALSQNTLRAKIARMAHRQDGEEEEIKKTDKVQYRRHNKPDWIDAKKGAKLYDKDRILIRPFLYADLRMESKSAKGRFTLWGDTTDISLPAAAYEIQKDPVKLGYYGLFVTYGSFVAHHLRGLITAKSTAMEVKPHGTRFMMTVEKNSGRTTVFVDDGEVTVFAGGDSLRLRTLDAAVALPGAAAVKINLSTSAVNQYSRLVRTHHTEIWQQFRPWWQSPWVYGTAAIAGSGVTAYKLFIEKSEDDNLATGTITVSW